MIGGAGRGGERRDRAQRVLNTIALLLVAAGVALYLFALARMNRIAAGADAIGGSAATGTLANVDRWHALRQLSNVGIGVTLAGIATMLAATIRHSLRTRRLADHGLQDRT